MSLIINLEVKLAGLKRNLLFSCCDFNLHCCVFSVRQTLDLSELRVFEHVNLLQDNKILALPNFKAFADDKYNVAQTVHFFSDSAENIVGKGENAGFQHFLLFPQCFQKASFLRSQKPGSVFTNHSLERSLSYSPDFSIFRSI